MPAALHHSLPPDILICLIGRTSKDFHPFYAVDHKIYWYHFFLERPSPFFQRYGYYVGHPIDMEKLEESLKTFVGTHDFRSFAKGDYAEERTVRTIDSIELSFLSEWNAYRVAVRGKLFLQYMVRRIVGASLQVASKDAVDIPFLQRPLEIKDSTSATIANGACKGLAIAFNYV